MTKTAKAPPAAATAEAPNALTQEPAPRARTKTEQLVEMLKTPEGASVEELSNTFGWMHHSTRAALTGLRKKGHAIIRARQCSVTVYRIDK